MDWLPEHFFHYLWKLKLFHWQDLTTTDGLPVQILHPGLPNTGAGPDFHDARLRIGDMLWAGAVEIHKRSSDWWLHGHETDRSYDNVILHVVYQHDSPRPLLRRDGTAIPVVELAPRMLPEVAQRYWTLLQPAQWIPCERSWQRVPEAMRKGWLDRLAVERLEQKTIQIRAALTQNQYDWEQTFYESLARSLGGKVNAQPMEQVARLVPQRLLARHKDNLDELEALLLGVAGLLEGDWEATQPREWQRSFRHLQQKYQLQVLDASVWKFAKLRPPNFPTLRLAQLAMLAHQSAHLFSKLLEIEDFKDLQELLDVRLSGFWLHHFTLDKTSPRQSQKTLGKDSIASIAINTLAPFYLAYGRLKQEEAFVEKALRLLESLPSEQNAIIDNWRDLGESPENALESQALLQLKQQYCDQKRCLECAVGAMIVRV